ncbi:MAG: RNA polymerase subunit sigma [Clostridiales bacterium]|nr:RNA polymerase subunit sigma [Clostridiales bacterium]
MNHEHEIVAQIYAAKEDSRAADQLLGKYLPFIKSETAKYIKRVPLEGHDDELSIAMFAFHEAVMSYQRGKGVFLSYAAKAIKNRLIDYTRKEQRHAHLISLDESDDEDDNRSTLEKLDTGNDNILEHTHRSAAKEELLHFAEVLSSYELELTDIADNCPRQERTLAACHRALAYAKENPELFDTLERTKKLPITQLSAGSNVERKTLERHRKYMVAILLAYTNGFEIIRGHLQQIAPLKGGQQK